MKHALFFYYIATIIFSIISFSMMLPIYLKNRNKILRYYLFLFSSFLFFFILVMILVYLKINILEPYVEIRSYVLFLRYFILNFTLIFMLYFIRQAFQLKHKIVERLLACLILIIAVLVLIILISNNSAVLKTTWIQITSVIYRVIVGIVIVLVFHRSKNVIEIKDYKTFHFLKRQLFFFLVYSILFVLVSLLKFSGILNYQPLEALIAPIVFITYSIINIRYVLEYHSAELMMEEKSIAPEFIDAHHITPREEKIILLIGEGLSNKEIADRLEISPNTVKVYIYNIFQKTGVSSRIGLLKKLKQRL